MKRLAVEEIGDISFFVIKNKTDSAWQDTGGVADLLEGFWRHSFLLFLFCQHSVKQGHPKMETRSLCYYTSNKIVTNKRSCLNLFPRLYTSFSSQVHSLLSTWLKWLEDYLQPRCLIVSCHFLQSGVYEEIMEAEIYTKLLHFSLFFESSVLEQIWRITENLSIQRQAED